MNNRFILLLMLAVLTMMACDTNDESGPFTITGLFPSEGKAFDTVQLITENDGFVLEMQIGDQIVPIRTIVRGSHDVVIPFLPVGENAVSITTASEEIPVAEPFEYLPLKITGVNQQYFPVLPNERDNLSDTLIISGENFPVHPESYQVYYAHFFNNDSVLQTLGEEAIELLEVDDHSLTYLIKVALLNNANDVFKVFLALDGEFYQLDYEFVGTYRLNESSIDNYPDNEIILEQGNVYFNEEVYLGDVKLDKLYEDPQSPDDDGFGRIHSYRIPTDLAAGSYELSVFESDGITPVVSANSTEITITDISYCIEQNSYQRTDNVRITVDQDFYLPRCYSCPVTAEFVDTSGDTRFTAEIVDEGIIDDVVYFDISIPDDIPLSLFSLELTTQNGYKYVLDQECQNPIVEILP